MHTSFDCNTIYIARNAIMNSLSMISTLICFFESFRLIRIQYYSKTPMKSKLFYSHQIFYICTIFTLPFAIAVDISVCFPTNFSSKNFERVFYGLKLLFFVSSLLMFNVILFGRLYFTFKGTVYHISKQSIILSISSIFFIIPVCLIFIGFTLYMIHDISLANIVLFTIGCLWLLIFSQILVFIFVHTNYLL